MNVLMSNTEAMQQDIVIKLRFSSDDPSIAHIYQMPSKMSGARGSAKRSRFLMSLLSRVSQEGEPPRLSVSAPMNAARAPRASFDAAATTPVEGVESLSTDSSQHYTHEMLTEFDAALSS
jgi:hypothetical protein